MSVPSKIDLNSLIKSLQNEIRLREEYVQSQEAKRTIGGYNMALEWQHVIRGIEFAIFIVKMASVGNDSSTFAKEYGAEGWNSTVDHTDDS